MVSRWSLERSPWSTRTGQVSPTDLQPPSAWMWISVPGTLLCTNMCNMFLSLDRSRIFAHVIDEVVHFRKAARYRRRPTNKALSVPWSQSWSMTHCWRPQGHLQGRAVALWGFQHDKSDQSDAQALGEIRECSNFEGIEKPRTSVFVKFVEQCCSANIYPGGTRILTSYGEALFSGQDPTISHRISLECMRKN